jgi:hypothetical protein
MIVLFMPIFTLTNCDTHIVVRMWYNQTMIVDITGVYMPLYIP